MSIRVGSYTLNARTTVVREHYEEVGGKQTRAIRITGLLRGAADEAALIATLDAITEVVSATAPVAVSLRPGRQLYARREAFERETNGRTLTGQFTLDLRAETPWEASEQLHQATWNITASGAALPLSNAGNAAAEPVIQCVAQGTLIAPAVGDGTRTLTYDGTIESGSELVIDGAARAVLLDGVDVTGYTTGAFPRLGPGDTTLTYTGDPASSHLIAATVAYRDRWY